MKKTSCFPHWGRPEKGRDPRLFSVQVTPSWRAGDVGAHLATLPVSHFSLFWGHRVPIGWIGEAADSRKAVQFGWVIKKTGCGARLPESSPGSAAGLLSDFDRWLNFFPSTCSFLICGMAAVLLLRVVVRIRWLTVSDLKHCLAHRDNLYHFPGIILQLFRVISCSAFFFPLTNSCTKWSRNSWHWPLDSSLKFIPSPSCLRLLRRKF